MTQPDRPTPAGPFEVVATVPEDDATGVDPQTGFRLQVTAPVDQAALSAVDIAVTSSGVQTGHSVRAGSLSTDLTGQSLTFALDRPLAPRTGHAITVSGIRSMDGQMLPATTVVFTTGVRAVASDAFDGQLLAELPGATTVAVGPDGHLYASSFFGTITRFELAADGTPTGRREVLLERTDRHFIGFDFQPDAPGVVWVSQWAVAPTDAFSTEIARYDLTVGVESEQTKVTGLPRHPSGDHSVQSIRFRGSKLYVTVGSATTGGARSLRSWGEPILVETPVTAAILEVDWADLGSGIDLSDGAVGPATRPVRLFATGLRNPYDLVWHANGNLYANINQNGGLGQGDSGAPTEGPCAGLPEFVDSHLIADTLNLVKRGGYYGHPNPVRDECVVMGGGSGPFAVGGYPAGQTPEPAFDDRLILSYGDTASGPGISVNGIDEYRAGGPLEGRLLAADSAGSRAVLVIDVIGGTERLQLAGPIEKLSNPSGDAFTFVHPLDVAVHPLGSVAVADFGGWSGTDFGEGGAIHLLTPTDG
ncbi:MAG: Ig-like domain-containing protein [Actinomycetota bacterium]